MRVVIRQIMVFVIMAAGSVAIWPVYKSEGSEGSEVVGNQLPSYAAEIRTIANRIFLREKIISETQSSPKLEDIKKLDFVRADEAGFGSNPRWEVFNEYNGGEKINKKYHSIIQQSSKIGKYQFTFSNRIDGLGTEQSELLAILPNVNKKVCEGIIRKIYGIPDPTVVMDIPISRAPNISSQNDEEIISLPAIRLKAWKNEFISGCFQADNIYYYYDVLYSF